MNTKLSKKSKKEIFEIVFTGGPCAGKTTAMCKIERALTARGYKVIFVSETATEIITNGVWPWEEYKKESAFQNLILNYQIKREKFYKKAAKSFKNSKVIIIYDRGVLDNKAYLPEEAFQRILAKNNLSESILRDRYGAVFHLVTAANGAEAFYTLENNKARTESIAEAVELDNKLLAAWTGHPHLRVIDNSTDFETKMKKLVGEVFGFLGEPVPVEIERKYLIRLTDLPTMLSSVNYKPVDIIQTYLHSDNPAIEERVRQRGTGGDFTYYFTRKEAKNIASKVSRIETEKRISKKDFLTLLSNANTSLHQIKKIRNCFIYNNQYFELDVFPFWKDYALMELELNAENQEIVLPPFIEVVKEVTEDARFKNYSLANSVPTEEELAS